jgi:hypothetical protein
MSNTITPKMLQIPDSVLKSWQDIVDILANLAGVPAGLIMRIVDEDIEVFSSSATEENPYTAGAKEHRINSGLYCERVIQTRYRLHVPDALADVEWKNNPDVKLNMISYLGYPIMLPNNSPFGTICILDSKPDVYSEVIDRLMQKFRDMIQSHLELLYMNEVMGERYTDMSSYFEELKILRGMIPICSSCKKIQNASGKWQSVEQHICKHPESEFTHSLCPACFEKSMKQIKNVT